VVIQMKMSVKD